MKASSNVAQQQTLLRDRPWRWWDESRCCSPNGGGGARGAQCDQCDTAMCPGKQPVLLPLCSDADGSLREMAEYFTLNHADGLKKPLVMDGRINEGCNLRERSKLLLALAIGFADRTSTVHSFFPKAGETAGLYDTCNTACGHCRPWCTGGPWGTRRSCQAGLGCSTGFGGPCCRQVPALLQLTAELYLPLRCPAGTGEMMPSRTVTADPCS